MTGSSRSSRRPGTRRIICASSIARPAISTAAISRGKGGTIVIPARKGGDLRAYLASLRSCAISRPRRLLPGHGPIVDDPTALIDEYIAHRQKREQQILQAILDGARTVDEIVRRVYPALPASLSDAAADSVRAHLAKLRDEGRARRLPPEAEAGWHGVSGPRRVSWLRLSSGMPAHAGWNPGGRSGARSGRFAAFGSASRTTCSSSSR